MADPRDGRRGVAASAGTRGEHRAALAALALPGTVWLACSSSRPLYVVLAIVFGGVDPIFRTPVPVWNPLQWNPAQFNDPERLRVFPHACSYLPGPRQMATFRG